MSNQNTQYIPFKINSKIRQSGTEINDTTFYLNGLDQANEGYDIHLRNFTIDNAFFNINSLNNVISLQHNTGLGTTSIIYEDKTITLPEENYNSTQFTTEYNTQTGILGITGLGVSYNPQSLYLTFDNQDSNDFLLSVNENQKFLGLLPDTYTIPASDTLVLNIPTDFTGPKEINILWKILL